MAVHPASRQEAGERGRHRRPPRGPAAHEHDRGPLLPSGPDGVDGGSLHRAGRRGSVAPSRAARRDPRQGNSAPLERIAGYRAPLAPHLARPSRMDAVETNRPASRTPSEGRVRLAEREGFEPSVRLPVHTLSKRAPSATRTSLQWTAGVPVSGRNGPILPDRWRGGQRRPRQRADASSEEDIRGSQPALFSQTDRLRVKKDNFCPSFVYIK